MTPSRLRTELSLIPARVWRNNAQCSKEGVPLDWFFKEAGGPKAWSAGLEVCYRCKVRLHCLAFAVGTETSDSRYGLWGGMLPSEREQVFG